MSEHHTNPSTRTLTVCCGLTLREPIERWLGPLRSMWPGGPPHIRLMTVQMLDEEPTQLAEQNQAGSVMVAVLPETEPFSQTIKIVEHARRSGRPALLLCERIDDRQRSILDEGILIESWDTDPAELISILQTLDRRQPTVTRLSRELGHAERLLSETSVPGSPADELHLAGLISNEMIPQDPPRIFGLELGIAHRSVGAIPRDFVDVSIIDEDTVRIFAANGISEGTAGALLAMRLMKAVRSLGENNRMHKLFHPGAALAELNEEVCEIGAHGVPHRASALYAVIEVRKGEITLASAGYPLPTIAGVSSVRRFGQAGSALGTRVGAVFPEFTAQLHENEMLALTNEGTERAFGENDGFDLADEILSIARGHGSLEEESRRFEDLFDTLPGSLHRTTDCTLLMMKLASARKFERGAA